MEEEVNMYANCPEGSLQKRIYDSYFIPAHEYLKKYFSDGSEKLKRFNFFYKNYVLPILNKEKRDEYIAFLYQKKPPFIVNYVMFDEFIDHLNKKTINDEELYYFMAFIYSTNTLFKTLNDFSKWKADNKFFNNKTLDDLLKMDFGANFVKANLRELKILN